MHSTQWSPSVASPVSASASAASATPSVAVTSRTRALSISASASSFSLSDYSSNDSDMSPFEQSDENEDDAVKSVQCKWLPDWVLFQLDARQLRLVLSGLQRQADGGQAMQHEHTICTMSVGLRDQLVHACMHAGYSAYFKLHSAAGWCVCYSEMVSDVMPAQDVRFDGSACRIRQSSGQFTQQEQATAIATQPSDLYDAERDGRVWCVNVEHDDHLIFAQRAHRNASGVVTKVGRSMIVGKSAQLSSAATTNAIV